LKQRLITQAAGLGLESIKQRVRFETKKTFFDLLLARKTVEVQEQLVRLREETLASERNKFEAGTISNFEVLRAEVALANSRTPLIQSKNNLDLSKEELKRVLSLRDEDIIVEGELSVDTLPTDDIKEAREIAVKNRPDLKQLRLLVKSREQGIKVQLAEYLPKITAYSNYTVRNNPFGGSGTLDGWQVGVRGTWNIFDSFAREGAVGAARSDKALAEINLERLEQEVGIEVSQAMLSWIEAQQLVKASKQVVNQAAESERLARARLEVGAATQLDVLDAQVQLTEARTNEIKALHQLNVTKAAIERSVGGFLG
jgi:outer membrane protein TolC